MILPADFAPERTLLIRPRGLGDVVLSTAVIDAVRRAYPSTRLDYLSSAPARALLEEDERLANVFLLSRGGAQSGRVSEGSMLQAVAWVRRGRYDLVLDLFSNPATALLTGASGARYRAGLAKRIRRFAYNLRIPRFGDPPRPGHHYAGDDMLDFVRAAGVHWEGAAQASVRLTPADHRFAQEVLDALGAAPGRAFAALLPGGSWKSKRWSVEGFVAAGEHLAERLGEPPLIVWGPPESRDARSIAERLGGRARLAPPTTLRQMAALLARAALLVSTDCLGRHLAIVQRVPTVGVFGTTDARDWTPAAGPHRWVQCPQDGTCASLAALPAAPVVREIDLLLAEVPLDSPGSGT
jgi:ADP-heptose:LPS heptosyltransferase